MSEGKWFGNSDYKTSDSCYFHTLPGHSDFHVVQFEAVKKRIDELCETRDGNGRKVCEKIYTADGPEVAILAYRFTSDWAYDEFNSDLIGIGGSLGRGIFEGSSDYLLHRNSEAAKFLRDAERKAKHG